MTSPIAVKKGTRSLPGNENRRLADSGRILENIGSRLLKVIVRAVERYNCKTASTWLHLAIVITMLLLGTTLFNLT